MTDKMYLSFYGTEDNVVSKQDLNGFVPIDLSEIDEAVTGRLFYTPFNSSEPSTSISNVANVVFNVVPIYIEDNVVNIIDSLYSTVYELNDLIETDVDALEEHGPLLDLRCGNAIELYADQSVYTWLNQNISTIPLTVQSGLEIQLPIDQSRTLVNAFVAGIDLDVEYKLVVYVLVQFTDRLFKTCQHALKTLASYPIQNNSEPVINNTTYVESSMLQYAKEKGWSEILTRPGL